MNEYEEEGGADAAWFLDIFDEVSGDWVFDVQVAPAAQRDLDNLDLVARTHAEVAIMFLARNPNIGTRKIEGTDSRYWIRQEEIYVAFELLQDEQLVIIARVIK